MDDNLYIYKNIIIGALLIGRDCAQQIASEYHEAFKGYNENNHKMLDDDVILIDRAINLLETMPETSTTQPPQPEQTGQETTE
jgi:hypothetical protein